MNELNLLMPELFLIVGAMILLLYGAFTSAGAMESDKGQALYAGRVLNTLYATLILLLYSAVMVSKAHVNTELGAVTFFNDFLLLHGYIVYAKYLLLFAAFCVVMLFFSWARSKKYGMPFEMPVLLLLATAGALFMVASCNLLSLYLSLELMSLSLYIMVAIRRHDALSSEAGLKYFILGALASGLYLFGASLIYGMVGGVGFAEIKGFYYAASVKSQMHTLPLAFIFGVLLITVAFCFKISAAPFHMWAPDVYQGAPTPVTAYLATVPKIAAILLLVRLVFELFADFMLSLQPILYFISVASMIIGSFGAIMQTNIKRLLAYSSIGHVGFILIGAVAGQTAGIKAVLLYTTIYFMMTLGAFACVLLINKDGNNKESIADLAGLGRDHPYLAAALATLMFSMAGIPPLAGFFAKFYVLYAAVNAQMYSLALAGVFASVVAAFYYLRVVKIIYFDTAEETFALTSCYFLRAILLLSITFNLLFIAFPAKFLLLAEISASWLS